MSTRSHIIERILNWSCSVHFVFWVYSWAGYHSRNWQSCHHCWHYWWFELLEHHGWTQRVHRSVNFVESSSAWFSVLLYSGTWPVYWLTMTLSNYALTFGVALHLLIFVGWNLPASDVSLSPPTTLANFAYRSLKQILRQNVFLKQHGFPICKPGRQHYVTPIPYFKPGARGVCMVLF